MYLLSFHGYIKGKNTFPMFASLVICDIKTPLPPSYFFPCVLPPPFRSPLTFPLLSSLEHVTPKSIYQPILENTTF